MANRLAHESSPYLLQHAENPVDWFPWGPDGLALARERDCPIFLSIGYSACHWCHVMERESFEDASIARILNENFVNIKVDREERPDLDQIYMNALLAMRGGGGGWPLNVFLTPDQQFFFGGTYWPPRSRVGMPGFDQVLLSVLDAFHNRRDQITNQSRKVTEWLSRSEESSAGDELHADLVADAIESLQHEFDFVNGGFGTAPKFPHCMDLGLLVQLASHPDFLSGVSDVSAGSLQEMVLINLKKMAYGGIFDHLGGGFARYSVDERWLVPHFEKMLYDNALLSSVYLDMYRLTEDPFFQMIARKTLDYLARDMLDVEGGIFSTEDADSEGEEGKFYTWSRAEILEVLDSADAKLFCELYNVTEQGNFEGSNILNMTRSYGEFADDHGMGKQELREIMRRGRATLLAVREQRSRPGRDDKVLVSWNGLGISAFAKMYMVSEEDRYLEIARKAARFIRRELVGPTGSLLHSWRNGQARWNAYLDDYSFLINGLVDLYEASLDSEWVSWATSLADDMIHRFADLERGGFFFTSDDHEHLIARPRDFRDSSVPSGNAMAATALIRLGRMTGEVSYLEVAESTVRAAVPLMQRAPLASGQMLQALVSLLAEHPELVLIYPDDNDQAVSLVRKHRPANSVVVMVKESEIESAGPFSRVLEGKKAEEGEPALFVCENFKCNRPCRGLDSIRREFDKWKSLSD